jgi:hypothetical protein
MNAPLTALGEGLKNNPTNVADRVADAIVNIGIACVYVSNPATQYDLGVAVENYLDAFGDLSSLPDAFRGEIRPESDDTRPLYQRIDDEANFVGVTIRKNMATLELVTLVLEDDELREQYHQAYLQFGVALGLPFVGEYDPADHPTVGKSYTEQVLGIDLTERPAA